MILEPIRLFYQKTLPAVFDDSLTYYEAIAKLVQKVNECIQAINDFEDAYKSYTDEQIAIAMEQVNQKIQAVYDYVNSQDQNLQNQINNNYAILNAKIDNVYSNLLAEIKQFYDIFATFRIEIHNWVENKINQYGNEVDEKLQEMKEYVDNATVGSITIFNIFRQTKTTLEVYLEDFYNYMRAGALTAGEYDSLKLTAGYYDSRYLKAYQYDVAGKWYLWRDYVFSPVTGLYGSHQAALDDLAGLHKNSLTAQEYDNLNLTVETYDNKNVTAYNYDFNGQTAVAS